MTNNQPDEIRPRRKIAHISVAGSSQLHYRNPYVVAFWSAMFPGLGHFMLSRYLRGYILIIWEFVINIMSHVNMALFYTLLGKIDDAKDVIDIRWSLLYIPTYLFAIWDSYRSTVDLNKHYILAKREDAPIDIFVMRAIGINTLDKRPPFVPCSWCLLTPGLGQLMLHRFIGGVFIIIFWIVIVYQSKVLPAIYFTFFGQFDAARSVLVPQWFLNIPSIYFFCPYVTYEATVEYNKLFDWEQTRFLRKNYQSDDFPFPAVNKEESGESMYVISAFEHTIEVETAITALEESGIPKNRILASSIEKEKCGGRFFETSHTYNTKSQFDLPMILGVVLSLLGCIYGFVLAWGPVVGGIIGALLGFGSGLLIKFLRFKKQQHTQNESEVIILVSCDENMAAAVKKLLSENGASGVNVIKGGAM